MSFMLVLYYCLTTGCFTIVYPEQYWSAKECLATSSIIAKNYKVLEKLPKNTKINAICTESDLGFNRLQM